MRRAKSRTYRLPVFTSVFSFRVHAFLVGRTAFEACRRAARNRAREPMNSRQNRL
jgi:hypothetical protein